MLEKIKDWWRGYSLSDVATLSGKLREGADKGVGSIVYLNNREFKAYRHYPPMFDFIHRKKGHYVKK